MAKLFDLNDEVYYMFFDTETTGLPRNYKAPSSDVNNWPRLVQLSWILTDKNYNVISTNEFIVYPEGFTIPTAASGYYSGSKYYHKEFFGGVSGAYWSGTSGKESIFVKDTVAYGLKLDSENKETATFFPFLSLESESKTESEEVTTCIDGRNVGKNIRPVSD